MVVACKWKIVVTLRLLKFVFVKYHQQGGRYHHEAFFKAFLMLEEIFLSIFEIPVHISLSLLFRIAIFW